LTALNSKVYLLVELQRYEEVRGAYKQYEESVRLKEKGYSREDLKAIREKLYGSLRLSPTVLTAEDYLVRMRAFYVLGEIEKSLEAADWVLRRDPTNEEALKSKVNLLAKLGRSAESEILRAKIQKCKR